MTKRPSEYTGQERQQFLQSLTRSILLSLTPSMPNRYSGQQVAYAKGRAWQQMQWLGF